MFFSKKSRKNKLIICSIFILAMVVNICNIYAARYDKENFPVSYISDVFPESYKPYIDTLKAKHPNWIFKAVYTGLNWDDSLHHESYEVNEGVSLVPDSVSSIWKKDGINYYKDGNFVIAAKNAVAYMLDPRNHINEQEIFQFETLSFNEETSSKEMIEKILYGTSMYQENRYKKNGQMITMDKQYSDIILEVARQTKVSATFIASRIVQETSGDIINNNSINGSFNGYEGCYNFFNISATPPNPISNALKYAKDNKWFDPQSAILGGVTKIKKDWIDWGQDTTYFQKFDVNNEGKAQGLYAYQYMTNILAPNNESIMTYKAYLKTDRLNDTFVFHIPVYENMTYYPIHYPGSQFENDYTKVQAVNLGGDKLQIRSGSNTTSAVLTTLNQGDTCTRIGKSLKDQWDLVKLDNGMIGYVFSDYITPVTNVQTESVSLNQDTLNLMENNNAKLEAKVYPLNAANKEVTWESSDENVVTVDQNGNIIAKNSGNAVITVRTKDTGKTATCNIKVDYIKVENIILNTYNEIIKPGMELQLEAIVKPDNAKVKEVIWESSNESIATVDKNGKVKAIQEGIVTITAATKDQGKIAKCEVEIENYIDVTGVSLNHTNKTIRKNENLQLVATVTPDNAKIKEIIWTSNDESIATVDKNGVVKGIKSGNVVITGRARNTNIKTECNITVQVDVENIILEKTDYKIKKGETVEVIPTIKPDNATNKEYNVEIKDNNIIEYVNNMIVAKNSGETIIKFISKDNAGLYIEVKVRVYDVNVGDIFVDSDLNLDNTDKYISKIEPGTKLNIIKDKILTNNKVIYYNIDGKELSDDDIIGTGTKSVITDTSNNIIKEYTFCIYGDITGDGLINSADLLKIRQHLLGNITLNNEFFIVADVNKDNTINSSDLLSLRKHLLDIEHIAQ